MQVSLLHRACPRNHVHIPIQGQFAKASATYIPELAKALAIFFRDHLVAKKKPMLRLDSEVQGLEDLVANDFCLSWDWKGETSWSWRGYRKVASRGGDCGFTYVGHSRVSRSALARGRTSSVALRPFLKKSAALCLGFGLYPAGHFGPTRLNPRDAPSRKEEILPACPRSVCLGLSPAQLTALASLPPLKSWASNWSRLACLLSPATSGLPALKPELRSHALLHIEDHEWLLDFDSTLGFPGEGWILLRAILSLALCWSEVASVGLPDVASHGDAAWRQAQQGMQLASGRRVTATTAFKRDWLFGQFQE